MTTGTSSRFSRRGMLAGFGLVFAAAGAFAAPALQLSWTRKPGTRGSWWDGAAPLHRAGLDRWAREVGAEFKVQAEDGTVSVRLAEVQPLLSTGRKPGELGRDRAFAAVFEAEGPLPRGDRIYKVDHAEHGPMDVYFSASGEKMVAVFG